MQGGKGTVWDFEVESTGNYSLAGVIHHNSGKTTSAAMEFGALITGRHIIGVDGKPIRQSRPFPKKGHPRIYWIIGWDVPHIGQTLHKNLFQPGMGGTLYAIKDALTGKYRVYDRTDPADIAREREKVLAGPIIPERLIEPGSWVWNAQGGGQRANCFSSVTFTNGAKLYAFPSSQRQAKGGDAVSGIMIDEDTQNPEHVDEWEDRLGDEDGWLIWAVWPRRRNNALIELGKQADVIKKEQPDRTKRTIEKFQLVFSENKFMTQKAIENRLEHMTDDYARQRRDRGELMLDELMMYPYKEDTHCIRKTASLEEREQLLSEPAKTPRRVIEQYYNRDVQFPRTWTRYLSIDPSHTRTACHSYVVPPPEVDGVLMGQIAVIEWELVVKKFSAEMLAEALKVRMSSTIYEEFIMDQQMGRMTRVGDDKTVFQAYEEQFRARGLTSNKTLSGFTRGCNVPATRYRAVRNAMAVPASGCPMLLLCSEHTTETQTEFNNYSKKQQHVGGDTITLDEPENPRVYDAMASVEYGITQISQLYTMGIAYVPLQAGQTSNSSAMKLAAAIKAENAQQNAGQQFVNFGPGSGRY